MKTAILLCEHFENQRTARPDAKPYEELFVELLGEEKNPPKVFDIKSGDFPQSARDFGKYIITGSLSSSYDADKWIAELKQFIVLAYGRGDAKQIGICFGHQIIADALGGKVAPNPNGWGVGKRFSEIKSPFLKKYFPSGKFALEYSHHDIVINPPEDAEILSGSDFCAVESMKIGEKILTFQGHPEFDAAYSDMLFNAFKNSFGEAAVQRREQNTKIPADNKKIARIIREF